MKTLRVAIIVGILAALLALPASGFVMDLVNRGEYDAGFDDGIEWAIENMEVWTALRPDGSGETVFIELGGLVYEHDAGRPEIILNGGENNAAD